MLWTAEYDKLNSATEVQKRNRKHLKENTLAKQHHLPRCWDKKNLGFLSGTQTNKRFVWYSEQQQQQQQKWGGEGREGEGLEMKLVREAHCTLQTSWAALDSILVTATRSEKPTSRNKRLKNMLGKTEVLTSIISGWSIFGNLVKPLRVFKKSFYNKYAFIDSFILLQILLYFDR